MSEMSKRRRPVGLSEQVLVLATIALVALGVVMVYSASSGDQLAANGSALFYLEREAGYALAGLLALALCARIDYRVIGKLSPLLIGGTLFLLIVVLGAGVTVNGARRWLPVAGGFTIQPSEIAKVVLCVFAAWTLSSRRGAPQTFKETMAPVGYVTTLLILFVMAGSDLGTALCLVLVAAAVLVVAGTRLLVLARLAMLAGGAIVLLILVEPYRMQRFTTFLDPWKDSQGSGYQITQGLKAIGQGGLTGVGLGQGGLKFGYLPEAHTDLILAITGEELGLIGTSRSSWASPHRLGGFSSRSPRRTVRPAARRRHDGARRRPGGAQLRRRLGVLPLTGVPIPFISFGGTSMIVTLAGIGMVLSVAAHDRVVAVKAAAPVARRRSRAQARPRPRPAPARTRRAAGGGR